MTISKGTYIVVTRDSNEQNNWQDYCFKQASRREDYLYPEWTPRIRDNYGHPDQESYLLIDNNWRYATAEEAARYEREGLFKITDVPVESTHYEIY